MFSGRGGFNVPKPPPPRGKSDAHSNCRFNEQNSDSEAEVSQADQSIPAKSSVPPKRVNNAHEKVVGGANAIPLGPQSKSNQQNSDSEAGVSQTKQDIPVKSSGKPLTSKPRSNDIPRKSHPTKVFFTIKRKELEIHEEDLAHQVQYEHAAEEDENVEVYCPSGDPVCLSEWSQFDFNQNMMKNIERCGYVRPRKIQSYVIPLILQDFDVKAQAETGSGKTFAYLIPMIHKITEEYAQTERLAKECHAPNSIIIAPTRELVIQIAENAFKLAIGTKVKVNVAYGEFDFASNSREIMKGIDILVATPGRLLHFLSEGVVSLLRLKCLCLDEADRLLDESFREDFEQLIQADGFPEKKHLQMLLFGATYPEASERWIDSVLKKKHATVKNARANAPNLRIVQTFEECSSSQKLGKLLDYVLDIIGKYRSEEGNEDKTPRILIFVKECQTADSYAFYLIANGIEAFSLNSKRGQRSREETMRRFRENKASVIVATDVMSRGVDIKDLQYVINLDMPKDVFTYVQRIGRTGRLETGYAHSFVDPNKDIAILSTLVRTLRKEGSVEIPQFMIDAVKPRRIVNTTLPVE